MKDRIKAAVDAREDESFVKIVGVAHVSVISSKPFNEDAGADMIFPEAMKD